MSCKQRKEWSNIIATPQFNLFHFTFKFFRCLPLFSLENRKCPTVGPANSYKTLSWGFKKQPTTGDIAKLCFLTEEQQTLVFKLKLLSGDTVKRDILVFLSCTHPPSKNYMKTLIPFVYNLSYLQKPCAN